VAGFGVIGELVPSGSPVPWSLLGATSGRYRSEHERRDLVGAEEGTRLGPDDLVLCSGTLRRDTPFAERVSAAAAAGFAGISLWGRDYAAARAEGLTEVDMTLMLADHGLAVGEMDPAWWWLPGASEIHIPPELDSEDIFSFGENELFAMAEVLGARSVNAVDVFGGGWDVDDAAEAFAGLCLRAAEHDLLVHIEWLPWSKIPDLRTALAVVRLADQPNGGLNVDAWHLVRSGTAIDELRAVPGRLIMGIQLDDGPIEPEPNLVEATLHKRALPGDGEFDLDGIVAALLATETSAPIGVEVFSDELHGRPAHQAAEAAATATRSVMARAR
jgi:sugar phosphate isomerase/epimerase